MIQGNPLYASSLAPIVASGVVVLKNMYTLYMALFQEIAWGIYPEDLIAKLHKKYPNIYDDITKNINTLDGAIARINQAIVENKARSAAALRTNLAVHNVRTRGTSANVLNFQFTEEEKDCFGCISELLCDISNTLLWRHAKVEDRNISVINRKLKEPVRVQFKSFFAEVAKHYDELLLWETRSTPYKIVTGFVAGESPKKNALVHSQIKPEAMINCDISKFFESTTYFNIIQNNLFLDSILSSIYFARYKTWPVPNVKMDENLYNSVQLAYQLNYLFMFMMPGFMHNGRIPTGAPFSPVVCNIVLRKADIQILGLVRKWTLENQSVMRYTRYADDITISSAKYKKDDGYILGIDKVKEIENVLNSYGYHLKYSKTKIRGKRDNKEITGVNITSNKPTISSERKMAFARELSLVRGSLSAQQLGHLSWIKSVNKKQWAFCLSHYFAHNELVMIDFMKHNPRIRFKYGNWKSHFSNRGMSFASLSTEENMLFIRYVLADDWPAAQSYFLPKCFGGINRATVNTIMHGHPINVPGHATATTPIGHNHVLTNVANGIQPQITIQATAPVQHITMTAVIGTP